MSELDIVRDIAKRTLVIGTTTGPSNNSFWDRSQRLVRNVDLICQLPELNEVGFKIDRFCLFSSAYFSDAGLVRDLETNGEAVKCLSPRNKVEDLVDISCKVVEEKLGSFFGETKVRKINRIIFESNNQSTKMPEGMILSDARNLDDMGAVGIFNELKQCVSNGKSISDALQIWKRKVDYQYWQARLTKSFHFDSVRKLAEQRLSSAEFFMNQLKMENSGQDLGEMLTEKVNFADSNE